MRLLLALLLIAPLAHAQPTATADALDDVLAAVRQPDGSVCYAALEDGPARQSLDRALAAAEATDAAALGSDAARLAFWSNAYNALMLDAVSEHPGRSDVLGSDEGRVFFRTPMPAGGVRLTLDELENVILRRGETDRAELAHLRVGAVDPRLHVALNCAAVSCPPLPRRAFRPSTLDGVLDRAMTAWVDDPAHFRVEGGALVASSLVDWFAPDFDLHEPAGDYLLGFMTASRPGYDALRARLAGKTSEQIRQDGARYAYDWAVNRADDC